MNRLMTLLIILSWILFSFETTLAKYINKNNLTHFSEVNTLLEQYRQLHSLEQLQQYVKNQYGDKELQWLENLIREKKIDHLSQPIIEQKTVKFSYSNNEKQIYNIPTETKKSSNFTNRKIVTIEIDATSEENFIINQHKIKIDPKKSFSEKVKLIHDTLVGVSSISKATSVKTSSLYSFVTEFAWAEPQTELSHYIATIDWTQSLSLGLFFDLVSQSQKRSFQVLAFHPQVKEVSLICGNLDFGFSGVPRKDKAIIKLQDDSSLEIEFSHSDAYGILPQSGYIGHGTVTKRRPISSNSCREIGFNPKKEQTVSTYCQIQDKQAWLVTETDNNIDMSKYKNFSPNKALSIVDSSGGLALCSSQLNSKIEFSDFLKNGSQEACPSAQLYALWKCCRNRENNCVKRYQNNAPPGLQQTVKDPNIFEMLNN